MTGSSKLVPPQIFHLTLKGFQYLIIYLSNEKFSPAFFILAKTKPKIAIRILLQAKIALNASLFSKFVLNEI